jgi:hypothetical protein
MKILIFIVVIIISIVRAVNKNKDKIQKAPKVPQNEPQQPLNEIWETILEDKKDVETEIREEFFPEESEIEEFVPEPIVEKAESKYQFRPQEEGASDIVESPKKMMTVSKKKKNILGKDFSLKKAVVYSEIINRKYV